MQGLPHENQSLISFKKPLLSHLGFLTLKYIQKTDHNALLLVILFLE